MSFPLGNVQIPPVTTLEGLRGETNYALNRVASNFQVLTAGLYAKATTTRDGSFNITPNFPSGDWDGVIPDNSITTIKLVDDAVIASKIADNAIHVNHILDGAITTLKIAANSVTEALIAANAVTTTKIADDAITTPKLIAGAVQASKIAAGAVETDKLAANAVTAAKIAALTITANEIAANAITAGKILAGEITTSHLAVGAVTANRIAVSSLAAISANLGTITAGSIDAGFLTAGTINVARFAASSITADKLNVAALSAITANLGTITAGTITADMAISLTNGAATTALSKYGLGYTNTGTSTFAFKVGDLFNDNNYWGFRFTNSGAEIGAVLQFRPAAVNDTEFNFPRGGTINVNCSTGTHSTIELVGNSYPITLDVTAGGSSYIEVGDCYLGGSGNIQIGGAAGAGSKIHGGSTADMVGPEASKYMLSVTHHNNSTEKYGLFAGTNWAATENKIFTAASIDASVSTLTERFSVRGDGRVYIGTSAYLYLSSGTIRVNDATGDRAI